MPHGKREQMDQLFAGMADHVSTDDPAAASHSPNTTFTSSTRMSASGPIRRWTASSASVSANAKPAYSFGQMRV